MKKRQKRPITLIEIMIVILLIGLIGGALAYNMRGSMDQGRAFKTRQHIAKAYDILMMEVANGKEISAVLADKQGILKRSYMVNKGDELLKDGWGKEMRFEIKDDNIDIISDKLKEWDAAHS